MHRRGDAGNAHRKEEEWAGETRGTKKREKQRKRFVDQTKRDSEERWTTRGGKRGHREKNRREEEKRRDKTKRNKEREREIEKREILPQEKEKEKRDRSRRVSRTAHKA